MCTKSAARRGLYVKPLHELADRGASASFHRDDSDNEFEFSEVYANEPPASPKLQTFAPPWKSAALSNDMVFITAQYQYGSAPKGAGINMIEASGRSIQSGVVASAADQNRMKKRVDLRSLMLERRELEQLPPLVSAGHRMNDVVVDADQKPIFSSSPSSSSSASSSKSSSVSSPASSSPQCNLHHGKKSRRWPVRLDFLHINKASPSKGAVDLRHHIDHMSNATTDELGDTIHTDAEMVVDQHENIFESPRKSTCSLTSSISSNAVKKEKKMIRGTLSAPVSPAGSPSRAPFSPAKGAVAHSAKVHQAPRSTPGMKSPLSPHAQHYQQQRARAEELRRRTFLPYRQSLFGACFFQSPPRHSQVTC